MDNGPSKNTTGHQILYLTEARKMFPSSGAISAARSYNDPGQILTGGAPEAKRGGIGAVLLQDQLPSTASSPLQRMSL